MTTEIRLRLRLLGNGRYTRVTIRGRSMGAAYYQIVSNNETNRPGDGVWEMETARGWVTVNALHAPCYRKRK